MTNNLSKSMVLDGIAASEAIDSSGEVLDIKGLDITSLKDGTGVLNYEHRNDQSEGASANDIIGSITYAKKVFGPKDCENDRELSYWNKVQLPFVYIQAELFDEEGHPGAQAAAALIRYYQRRKLPILMRYSIEGSTLERDPNNKNKLLRAIARRVAATIKPCNRSCVSGVVSDSKDVQTEVSKDVLAELVRHEDPNRVKLGSYEGEFEPIISDPFDKLKGAVDNLREMNELNKAISAGGYNAAPTTLTGGSALQVENIDSGKRKKHLQNQAMGVLRDWRGRGDLKKFLKHRMPDASEDFIEHFSRLVEDYQFKKMVYLEENLIKAVTGTKPPIKIHEAKVKEAHSEEVENLPEEKIGDAPLTIRGKAIRPLPTLDSTHFDERKGTLYTPRGAFKMYLPQNDKTPGALESFNNILNDPKLTAFHDYATSNWLKLHKMARDGRLPPEIIMHATLFSQLSPNTPVPVQELMYAHLVDSMKHGGVDARSRKFAKLKDDWRNRDQPAGFPEHSGEYFKGPVRSSITIAGRRLAEEAKQGDLFGNDPFAVDTEAKPSKHGGRLPGELQSFMLADSKFANMSKYWQLHDQLVDLFGHHRHDARGIVAELMQHKYRGRLHDAMRQRHLEAGNPDPGEYDGPDVPGLAPKTGRYMAAMAGGGNVHVPDTHFSRYLFGLEKGTDSRTIAYIKNVLWNTKNTHVLDAIDRFYAKNHPAVQHMMEHPTFGKHFADREDAIFPAFWKNWVAIAPHERFRKMKTMAYNEATDHRPFWDAIQPFVKSEDNSATLPLNTARTHAKWVEEHGEIPALMLYYAHIVPQLLRASRANESVMVKMDRIKNNLIKAVETIQALPEIPKHDTEGLHEFLGSHVKPGEIEISSGSYKGSRVHFLGVSGGYNFVKPKEGEDISVRKLHAANEGTGYKILSHPKEVHIPKWVDANLHSSELNNRHSQNLLLHGIDLKNIRNLPAQNTLTSEIAGSGWYRNLSGQLVYVKPDTSHIAFQEGDHPDKQYIKSQQSYPSSHRELMYKNMANDFFGLGHMVPETAVFNHPDFDAPVSLQGKIIGAEHFDKWDDTHLDILNKLHESGDLDKIALMDMAQGNTDRHLNNFMLTPQKYVSDGDVGSSMNLHDNGMSLDYNKMPMTDIWYAHSRGNDIVSSQVRDWFLSLSPEEFSRQQLQHKVPQSIAKMGYDNFREMQLMMMDDKLNNRETFRDDLRSIAELRAKAAAGEV